MATDAYLEDELAQEGNVKRVTKRHAFAILFILCLLTVCGYIYFTDVKEQNVIEGIKLPKETTDQY